MGARAERTNGPGAVRRPRYLGPAWEVTPPLGPVRSGVVHTAAPGSPTPSTASARARIRGSCGCDVPTASGHGAGARRPSRCAASIAAWQTIAARSSSTSVRSSGSSAKERSSASRRRSPRTRSCPRTSHAKGVRSGFASLVLAFGRRPATVGERTSQVRAFKTRCQVRFRRSTWEVAGWRPGP